MTLLTGMIFDIQRFSIHDGPGIRTTVFFKGCSLRCFWCHNPESIRPHQEIQFYPERCIGCGACVDACDYGARSLVGGVSRVDRDLCAQCGACADQCFAGATRLVGRDLSVDEVWADICADRAFYESSGGGVTLSGGEPVLQGDFALELLARCKAAGIHTAIETAGNYHWTAVERLLPVIDLIMMDLKHMDAMAHRGATGVDNRRVLENAARFAATDKPIVFRIPVIPTFNDSPEAVRAIAAFVRQLSAYRAQRQIDAPITYELLKFHRLAADKYRSLNLDYRASALETISNERMSALDAAARAQDVMTRSSYQAFIPHGEK